MTWTLFKTGVQMGINGAEQIISSGMKDRLISAVEILGILVVGAVTASTANNKRQACRLLLENW